jgi:hypothetical protein
MRILFLLPLSTQRYCTRVADSVAALGALGHEVHVFTRDSTRARAADKAVLSRNPEHVDKLARQVGADRVSRLHSHVHAQPGEIDLQLDDVDRSRLASFAASFVPDGVVVADDPLIGDDPMVKGPWTRGVQASWSLRAEGKSAIIRGPGAATGCELSNAAQPLQAQWRALVASLDAASSKELARAAITRQRELLVRLLNASSSVPAAAPSSPATAAVVPGDALPAGELESIRDGDVVFGRQIWIKGWIDTRNTRIRSLLVRINASEHEVPLDSVRGDVAERLGHPDVFGFELEHPIVGEGPPLDISLALVRKDEPPLAWKQVRAWANDCVPDLHAVPILRGDLGVQRTEAGALRARGWLEVDEYPPVALDIWQAGRKLASMTAAPGGRVEIDLPLPAGTETARGLHAWVDLQGLGSVHWLRCAADAGVPVESSAKGPSILNLAPGQVLENDGQWPLEIEGPSAGSRVSVVVNGRTALVSNSFDPARPLTVPLAGCGNQLSFEVEDESGGCSKRLAWRHLSELTTAAEPAAIAMPARSTVSASASTPATADRRRVLLLRKAPSPTDELYMLAPLQPWLVRGEIELQIVDLDDDARVPVDLQAALLPGTTVLISRYVTPRWIQAITERKATLGEVFYLMDDDVAVAVDSRWLPRKYRLRMMAVAGGEFQTLLRLCDRFIATSQHLLQRYASAKTRLLEPPYLSPPRDLAHLQSPEIVVTYQGTEGHKDDLAAIAPALRAVHDAHPNVRLQIIVGNLSFFPECLRGLERCKALPPMTWTEYKAFRARDRAHIAVVPLLDTPYNRGKSIIKLHDISALGAAGVFSNCPPYDAVIEHGVNGLLVENDPLMWQKALVWLIKHPDELRRIAQAAQQTARSVGDVARLQAFWATEMGGRT